jgi:hypothetical protein
MKYTFAILFISISAWAGPDVPGGSSPVLDPNKFTVCAITINSDDEKKVFDAQVKKHPSKFNPIVELTNFNGGDDWFKKSCESGLKCDQLIISGHFGGDFFSEDGNKNLKLRDMEKASCDKSCDGILKNPLEIFLFGCNTLSNKDEDSRTPAQYLQVLLRDGIPLAQAEMVVESRYGNVGDSHRGIMQRVFSGEKKQIYGFDSIGPAGKNVKGFLNNYFAKVSAPSRLELLQAKRLMDKVDLTNKALAESLKVTAFAQCPAGPDDDPVKKNLCALQDRNIPVADRIDLVQDLLAQENYLSYLPAINSFFNENTPAYYDEKSKAALAQISNNTVIKGQIAGLVASTKSLGLKAEWLKFSQNLGFINPGEREKVLRKAIVSALDKKLTESQEQVLCQIDYEPSAEPAITLAEIKFKDFGRAEANVLGCLGVKDPAIFKQVEKRLKVANDPYTAWTMMNLLSNNSDIHTKVDPAVIAKMKPYLVSKDSQSQEESMRFMSKFAPQDVAFKKTLQSFLGGKDEDRVQMALGVHSELRTQDPQVIKQIVGILRTSTSEYTPGAAVSALMSIGVKDPQIVKEIKEIYETKKLESYSKEMLGNLIKSLPTE